MKKIISLTFVVLIFLALTGSSCIRKTGPIEKKKLNQTDTAKQKTVVDIERKYQYKYLTVTKEEFALLVEFIEKEGFIAYESGIPSDHQYNFIDSKGTRHGLITIKRDDNDLPSTKGNVKQISVYAYKDFKKKGRHSENGYTWYIHTIEAALCLHNEANDKQNFTDMSAGFNEFLTFVKKHSK